MSSSAIEAFAQWADFVRSTLTSQGIEASVERVHHDSGLNDSLFLEIWCPDVMARVTVYEHSPDIDVEAFNVCDGLNLIDTHLTDATEVQAKLQTLFNEMALEPTLEWKFLAALPSVYRPAPALKFGG